MQDLSEQQTMLVNRGINGIVELVERPHELAPIQALFDADLVCPSSLPVYRRDDLEVSDGPSRVLGRCINKQCAYYKTFCSLGVAVAVSGYVAVTEGLMLRKPCSLKNECRWYAENGELACQLCPHIPRIFRSEPQEKEEDQ